MAMHVPGAMEAMRDTIARELVATPDAPPECPRSPSCSAGCYSWLYGPDESQRRFHHEPRGKPEPLYRIVWAMRPNRDRGALTWPQLLATLRTVRLSWPELSRVIVRVERVRGESLPLYDTRAEATR